MNEEFPQSNPEELSAADVKREHYEKLSMLGDLFSQIERRQFQMPYGAEEDGSLDQQLLQNSDSVLTHLNGEDPMVEAMIMGATAGALRTPMAKNRYIPGILQRLDPKESGNSEFGSLVDLADSFTRIDNNAESKMSMFPRYQSAIEYSVSKLLDSEVPDQNKPILLAAMCFAATAAPPESRSISGVGNVMDKVLQKAKGLEII